jgi:DNA polymerase-3 subunit gamma/tau
MSYLVFARKYRPQTFEEVVQQDHVTRTLSNAIAAGRVPHAVLFTGPRGTGKTTVARILAKAMNCVQGPTATPCNQCRSCMEITSGHAVDVFEIDGASNNSVDQIRELRDNLKFMPVHSRYKIYIIDEVHMLSLAAFNALLKTLEEPPAHVLFIFATTEPQKIPITILSRCQRHDLRRIDLAAVIENMRMICDKEQMAVDNASLALIAREAGGSMRDALSLLDHVIACADGPVTADLVGELLGVAERRHLFELAEAVLAGDIGAVLAKIDMVWRCGLEIKRFFADVVTFFRHLTLAKLGATAEALIDLPESEIGQMHTLVAQVPESRLVQLMELLFLAEPSIKLSNHPKLALEMVFFKLFQTPPALSVDVLIERLDHLRSAVASGSAMVAAPAAAICAPAATRQTPSVEQLDAEHGPAIQPPAVHQEGILRELDPQAFWQRLLERAGSQKPALAASLNKCNLKALEDERAVIEVCGNEFILNSVRKHLRLIEELSGAIRGRATGVVLEANIEDAAFMEEQKKKNGLLKQKALSHPLVLEALELFDGRVIDVKLKQ